MTLRVGVVSRLLVLFVSAGLVILVVVLVVFVKSVSVCVVCSVDGLFVR